MWLRVLKEVMLRGLLAWCVVYEEKVTPSPHVLSPESADVTAIISTGDLGLRRTLSCISYVDKHAYGTHIFPGLLTLKLEL